MSTVMGKSMFARLGATAAVALLAAVIATSAHAQSSSVRIVSEGLPDGAVIPAPAAPLAISDTEYPLAALTEAQEGSMTLNLIVDAQGRVTFAQRLSSSGSDVLDQTAVQIARTRWTFRPARKNGEATVGSTKVEVTWKLPLRPADDLNAQIMGGPITGRIITLPSRIREAYRITSGDYPYASARAREQGEVVLNLLVLEDGTVGDVRIASSSGFPRLDERAMELARDRFTYRPGTVDGQPTRMSILFVIPFGMNRVPTNVRLRYCRSGPVFAQLLFAVNPEAEESDADGASQTTIVALQYHVTADGTVDDVILPTKRGWMHFNQTLVQNFSRVAAIPPATRTNRPPSCWFDGRTVVAPMQQNSAEAQLQSGLVNRRLDDPDRAIEDYTKAIAINPNLASAYYNRAVAYQMKGEYENALRDHDQSIRINPTNPVYLAIRGQAYRALGRFEEAVKDLDQAIKLNPGFAIAFNVRCYALASWGKAREAIADCNTALRLRPGDAATLDSRGYAYLRMGDHKAAIADYDAAIKANPRVAESYYGRGVAKIKLGNANEGNADMAEAIKLNPDIAETMAKLGVTP